jgi:hypothetical protein
VPKLKDLKVVDLDYLTTGPRRGSIAQPMPKSAEAVWRSFADADAWKAWLGIEVEWLTPEPYGIGTRRRVTANGQTIDECYLVHDEPRRIGWYFERATLPLAALAEEWVLVDEPDGTCTCTWNYAFEWGGPLDAVLGRAFNAFFRLNGRRAMKKFAAYMGALPPGTEDIDFDAPTSTDTARPAEFD